MDTFLSMGNSKQRLVELGQIRLGSSLWDAPGVYINNSPIFKANKVVTPVLLMNNKLDLSVHYSQGVEFFLALRRLGKKVWMLQYDEGAHSVVDNDAIDYTVRIQQFFDHYLKDAPAPIWMTQGIPAKLKVIVTGYAYDPFGNCGKDCKVCKMWNEKMKKDSVGTWKEIEEKKKSDYWQ